MPKEDRDKSGDVGSGRRRITRDDQGKDSQKKDKASDATHLPEKEK